MTNIKLENFSRLSDQECGLLLQGHLLETFEIEDPTYLEWEVMNKFISVDYSARESLSKLLNSYLKKNTQNIGGLPVNIWLKKYLDKQRGIPREPNTFLQYSMSNLEIQKLNEKDRIRLMRIFRIYDYFLIEPIVDWDDTAAENIMRYPMYLSQPLKEILAEMSSAQTESMPSSGTVSEKLAVKEALRKFPKLGEQTVTAGAIKLKQFDQPVRPSVRNWLYDYTSQLGQTGHSSMDRTTYLFRSDNAKNLSSPEREKLGIILKSFDENAPLPIDGSRQEIVFESFVKKEVASPRYSPAPPRPSASLNFIHHVEKSPAPIKRNPASVPRQQFPPTQKQETSFVRPYPAPALTTTPPVTPKREVVPPIPKQLPTEMRFTNPYPKPVTHEPPIEKKDDNISNVRFSDGAPKDTFTSISQVSAKKIPPAPIQKPAPAPASPMKPAAYRFIPPDRNMIYPHSGGDARREKPEPRLDGNIVDLKGDQ